MSAEHLLYAGHPEGAYALVWSPEGHPRHPEPGPFPPPCSPPFPICENLRDQGLGAKMPTEGKGIHRKATAVELSHQGSHSCPRQLLLRTVSCVGGGVGVTMWPPPFRVTHALGSLWDVWLLQLAGPPEGGARVAARPSISRRGQEQSLMGSRLPSSILWSDASLIPSSHPHWACPPCQGHKTSAAP